MTFGSKWRPTVGPDPVHVPRDEDEGVDAQVLLPVAKCQAVRNDFASRVQNKANAGFSPESNPTN